MAEQNINPVGCLGRLLTFLGVVWVGVVVLGGIGLLSERGMSNTFLTAIGGSIIPALLLLAAGRALRRRARTMDEGSAPIPASPIPTTTPRRVATSRPGQPRPILTPPRIPETSTTSTPPGAVPRPVEPGSPRPPSPPPPRTLEEVIPPPGEKPGLAEPPAAPPQEEPVPARPKTSQELVEEARKRWGRRASGR